MSFQRSAAILIAALMTSAGCRSVGDRPVAKRILHVDAAGPNLLQPGAWEPWHKGFAKDGATFVCDNDDDAKIQRGLGQKVVLNQTSPAPIVATAWSKAEKVGGSRDNDYSLYLDLEYMDGEALWGQTATFDPGTHDWEKAEVTIVPQKPVKTVSLYLLLRRHSGKAWFRTPVLQTVHVPDGATVFDGVPVTCAGPERAGLQIRDVGAGSDFLHAEAANSLGLELELSERTENGARFFDLTARDLTGADRAITLYYVLPLQQKARRWHRDPRHSEQISGQHDEYVTALACEAGATGRLSRYPLAAVDDGQSGHAIAIDMAFPAVFRVGYNAAGNELFVAYDLGLTPEKRDAHVRFCTFEFAPDWKFRAALARVYELFPSHFTCRTSKQGLWMPFAKISEVEGWQDFGFAFKEGNNEKEWDDAHGITTFRYTEPMTWWMKMADDLPRTLEAAEAEGRRLAADKQTHVGKQAQAWLSSSFHDERGQSVARLLDTPWCKGAVWSMNSMPGVRGDVTDFSQKWSAKVREHLYGPGRKGDLDGEYIDSSEGYVTAQLNFRRDHFAACSTPLTFACKSRRPAIFRGLVTFEYIRAIADDVHDMGKLMMANSTPSRLCWLAPLLDVMGTETDWNHGGHWRPLSDEEMLFRRSMCGPKPYCFLQNTDFALFSHGMVRKFMERSLAYGMFPGFFSADASTGHYFTRPELYNRDRPLFRKYVPLCKLVAEAGWKPVTLARTDTPDVYIERFGDRYLTVFNTADTAAEVTLTADPALSVSPSARELVQGTQITWQDSRAKLRLEPESVRVLELQ